VTDGIVLAGGRLGRGFPEAAPHSVKALLSLGGETLLGRVVAALRGSACIRRIAVVGPPEVADLCSVLGADQFVSERGTGPDNITAGLDALGDAEEILIATSDLPFVLPADVDDMISLAPDDADLCYAIIERHEFEAMYPVHSRVFIPLHDGSFTGGGLVKARAAGLRAVEPHLRRVFLRRKSPLAMARLFGMRVLVRGTLSMLTGGRVGLSSDDICRRMQEITGRRGAIVRGCSPRVAFDVDTADDWRLAREIVEKRGRTAGDVGG
jgi:GTP:adenosylcobinamide-phosphate guanylyltransferase